MDLQERLSYLETVRDWQSMVEELEKGIAGGDASNAAKAQYHLRLGRVLEGKFLAGVKALKHFQDAYKLNPALIEALENARAIYWDLGKLNMVQKLCELELKSVKDDLRASGLLLELGDVLHATVLERVLTDECGLTTFERPPREPLAPVQDDLAR